jgi:branched-subunit amino acid transport protein AzlD
MAQRLLERWRLAFKVLPFVAAAGAGKLLFTELGWESVSLNPLYTGLVAGNVFLLGFLLAGTLADYKESEKLPGELAASVETIADECSILYRDKQAQTARDCLEHLRLIVYSLRSWLRNRERKTAVLDRIGELNGFFLVFESLTQPNFIVRLKQEQSALRRMVIRINTIRETSFVGAGYAIAELTTFLLVAGLLFVEFGSRGAEVFLICTIAFLLVYMLALIRDLDNPFEYDGEAKEGAAEVSLEPLDYLEQRIARELGGVEPSVV